MKATGPLGEDLARSLVLVLGLDCRVAAEVTRAILSQQGNTIDLRSIALRSPAALQRVTEDFVDRGWLIPVEGAWQSGPTPIPAGVASFLEGAAAMRAVIPDEGRATAVVTMPRAPSAIAAALPATGMAYAALVPTQTALETIADAAINSLTIMTPFLNADGLTAALDLFRRTRASQRRLVVRRAGGARAIVERSWDDVDRLGIVVSDYTLPAAGGYETFHAKVVLADQDYAYVGSANMTIFARWSIELGVLMDGRAARVIASVVRAIERIATPLRSATDRAT